jgi:hypothetical protein
MPEGKVAAKLSQTADPQQCPNSLPTTPSDYLSITGVNSGAVQQCQGGPPFPSRTAPRFGTRAFAGVRECPRQESNLEPSD